MLAKVREHIFEHVLLVFVAVFEETPTRFAKFIVCWFSVDDAFFHALLMEEQRYKLWMYNELCVQDVGQIILHFCSLRRKV